jgi:hypothetical protein
MAAVGCLRFSLAGVLMLAAAGAGWTQSYPVPRNRLGAVRAGSFALLGQPVDSVPAGQEPAPMMLGIESLPEKPELAAALAPAGQPAADRWFIMKCLQGTAEGALLDGSRIQVSGWTDGSYTFSTDHQFNLPLGFNYVANDFLIQQNWLRIERPVVVTDTSEPSFGFRSDTILPGTDYFFTLPRGLFNHQLVASNGRKNRYGIDPIQFYAEAYFPTIARGMDIKVGRFFSQYGVETTDAPNNPLFSHSNTDINDPFTHTGILTTTRLTDVWSVQAGLVLGSDVWINPADNPTFIGSVKWAPATAPDSVLFSIIVGKGRFDQARNFHNPEVFDLVYTRKINARLTWNTEVLYGFTSNVPGSGFANWLGNPNFLTWVLTPRLSSVTRIELFDDFQGQRTGFPGLYTAVTTALIINVRKGLIFRPELRFDDNVHSRPYENKHGLFTASSDVIVRW